MLGLVVDDAPLSGKRAGQGASGSCGSATGSGEVTELQLRLGFPLVSDAVRIPL